jgi:hypothetical protein
MCGEKTEDALETLFVGDEYLACDVGEFVHGSHYLGCANHLSLNV